MFEDKLFIDNPIPIGMVGGGKGSQIGYAHRTSLARDKLFCLKAGAFDIDYQRGQEFAASIGIAADRCYENYQTLIEGEAKRAEGIKALIVATPNNTHYAISKMALEHGLHVICEKPLTFHIAEAEELQKIATRQGLIMGVMYGYSGYTMIEQMHQMIKKGDIGSVRMVNMQFAHGYHAGEVEKHDAGLKWRITPEISGHSYVIGDIGTHCFQLAQYVTGLSVDRLLCTRQSFIPSRAPLEDNAQILLQYKGGAIGYLWASAINIGSAHSQKIHVIGETGSIEWWDEHPNQLKIAFADGVQKLYEHGHGYLHEEAKFNRIGGGHPEGFFDSWANLYRRFGLHMAKLAHLHQDGGYWYPSFKEGIEGVKLIEKAVYSANHHNIWVEF